MDEDLINSKIDTIEENTELIEGFRKEEFSKFKNNKRDIQAAKHCLQESIEACIDIAYHIVSSKGYGRPDDYRDSFKILEEKGIIEKKFSEHLQDMASFRNLLVHRYGEIDLERLYKILKEDSKDIEKFVEKILDFIEG